MYNLSPPMKTALIVGSAVTLTGVFAYYWSKKANATTPMAKSSPNPVDITQWIPSPMLEPGQIYEVAMFCPSSFLATCNSREAIARELETKGFLDVNVLFIPSDSNFTWPASMPKPSDVNLLRRMVVFMGVWGGPAHTQVNANESMMPLRWVGGATGLSGGPMQYTGLPGQLGSCCGCGGTIGAGGCRGGKTVQTQMMTLGARTKQTLNGYMNWNKGW